MSDDLNRQIFKEEAYDLLSELEGSLLELEDAPEDMDLVNRVFRALHTIKGSGSMFGFEDIAEFTHEVETVFDMVRSEELVISTDLLNLAFKARDHIQKMLDNADSEEVVDPEGMSAILLGLQQLSSGEGDEAAVSDEGVGEGEVHEDDATASEAPEDDSAKLPLKDFLIHVVVKDESGGDIACLEPLLDELAKIGELKIEAQPETGQAMEDGYVWDVRFATAKGAEDIRDIFLFTSVDLSVDVTAAEPEGEAGDSGKQAQPVATEPEEESTDEFEETPRIGELLVEEGAVQPEDIEDALKKQKPIGQILKESGKVDDEQLSKAVSRQAKAKEEQSMQKKKEAVSSIRVAAEKLDWLVDLVGELVIVQAQISQVVSERSDPVMTALSEELERLSDELRDSTLGIRMLPIGTTFSKFRRLVRDLSSELNKEIVLNTNGAETELDKTVIERLGDPLVHLLRNSIDHGIEIPHVREAAGKPAAGMILLSAEHSGGEVLIRITDDGQGMDPAAIRAKAVERGMISPDAELSDKELFKLIFEPGFSTAQKVTNVSGRGVGMDVVKRAIDSLRGIIDIDSRVGKGTTITIRLPLTLAIIDGLQVQVGNEFYVIPLSLVEECVELNRAEIEETEGGHTLLHLRGEIVPYIHLRDFFMVEGEQPSIEQIVITGVEGSRVGIVVDTVIGEHQTVIKSLSRVYKDVEGISGATIKGDGSIALILDVPSLVRRIVVDNA
ncbi:chemotaxis protein CheA [Pseudodesulfovibrio senegalensis]|uniref:Chemotaxis protein CheA n=1 Tax=Pseudodesulfovibrio senegalensis TaxID=1721087 RepID=A0A6N6N2I2_9BACT|nr:chemotaxis protein CheA [Pseudodesulfovibrio senegalensis]KAB1441210.1 chemotaxis protein CheA [Pseudodesulfovibrio senegalensis]